jgi:hypothetical protein
MASAMFGVIGLAVSVFPLLGGAALAYAGWRARDTGTKVDETDTTRVSDIRPGRVAVTGTVRPVSDGTTVRSPIGRATAVAYRTLVQGSRSGNSDTGGHWERLYSREDSVPFLVDDGRGTVRVDPPASADQRFEWQQVTVQPGDEPPPAVQSFVEREGEVDESGGHQVGPVAVGSRRRYSEGVLEPGENVYVLGKARETDAGWDDHDYVIDQHTTDDFILSDKPPDELATQEAARGTLYLAVGGIAAVAGLVGILISTVFFL